MPFRTAGEAQHRVAQEPPLTEQELEDLIPFARALASSTRDGLATELALRQIAALRKQEKLIEQQISSFDKFDKATAKANLWMIGFTAAVTAMTLLLVVLAILDRH